MTNILICGDSFAADWSCKYPYAAGWPNLLAKKYNITNLAQAGCSEYKIFKQLSSQNLDNYQKIILVHTSPYRISVEKNPLHCHDILHKDCDFIYLDVKKNCNPLVNCVVEYFEKYYWDEHAQFVYNLTILEEEKLIKNQNCLHLTMFPVQLPHNTGCAINFNHIFNKYPGNVNHLSQKGNKIVYKKIAEWIECESL